MKVNNISWNEKSPQFLVATTNGLYNVDVQDNKIALTNKINDLLIHKTNTKQYEPIHNIAFAKYLNGSHISYCGASDDMSNNIAVTSVSDNKVIKQYRTNMGSFIDVQFVDHLSATLTPTTLKLYNNSSGEGIEVHHCLVKPSSTFLLFKHGLSYYLLCQPLHLPSGYLSLSEFIQTPGETKNAYDYNYTVKSWVFEVFFKEQLTKDEAITKLAINDQMLLAATLESGKVIKVLDLKMFGRPQEDEKKKEYISCSFIQERSSLIDKKIKQVFSEKKDNIPVEKYHVYEFQRGKNSANIYSLEFNDKVLLCASDRRTIHLFSLNDEFAKNTTSRLASLASMFSNTFWSFVNIRVQGSEKFTVKFYENKIYIATYDRNLYIYSYDKNSLTLLSSLVF